MKTGNILAIIVAAGLIAFTAYTGHADVTTTIICLVVIIGQAAALIGRTDMEAQALRERDLLQVRLDDAIAALAKRGRR